MATTMEEEESHELLAMEMVTASVAPMVLKAAVELHVFDIIAEAGAGACLSTHDIVSRLPTQNPDAPRLLDCMMRLLVSHSLLTCTVLSHDHKLYHLAPASKLLIKNKDGASFAPYVQVLMHQSIINSWYYLKESILDGGGSPFYKAHGMIVEDYLGKNPKLGVEFVAGDMLTSIPDAILMKHITHNCDDEDFLKLLKNCYKALPDYGKVIVVDLISPTYPETNVASKFILQMEMSCLNPTGKERPKEQFTALAREAGFAGIAVACCAYLYSVIEFHKLM
ncbi:hypothetical protein NE237_030546 [Protea cynaroides]|uniref:Caffeic acid O-methyltransferase n=1 Tax=Protea cynaroides TaxID=273540 RepID=A0A9Q0GUB2_9MAGN|nr:hypothetical protein NE237_030546 [Protea cynaroides]